MTSHETSGDVEGLHRDWANCPICDEPDMLCEIFDEGATLIRCTNHGCQSNKRSGSAAVREFTSSTPRSPASAAMSHCAEPDTAAPQKPAPDARREAWSALARLRSMTPAEFKAYHSCVDLLETALRNLSAPVPPPDGLKEADHERVFADICDELGCAFDNEAALVAIASLKKRVSDAGAAEPDDDTPTCACGQAGHGNTHEPSCPLSDYRPVKSGRQLAIAEAEPDDDWEARSERSYIDNTKPSPPDDVRSALADDERIIRQFFNDGADGNRARKALDRIVAAIRSAPVSWPPYIEIPLTFQYKNHRGEVAARVVFPISVRFGATEWHPEAQWLLRAFDRDKQAEREFAMRDINPPAAPPVRDRTAINSAADEVVRRVAEYDDRTSPDDFPEALLITPSELHTELTRFADDLSIPVQSSAAVGVTREALIEKEAQRRCLEAEYTLDRLALQDRRFRHDDQRPWWKAYFEPTVRYEIEKLEKAGFALSPAPDATVSEPVAWRWRFKGVAGANPWRVENTNTRSKATCEIEPLYTSSQDVRREATVSARDAVDPDVQNEKRALDDTRLAGNVRDAVIEAITGYVHDQAADPPFTLEKYRAGILKAVIRSLAQGARP